MTEDWIASQFHPDVLGWFERQGIPVYTWRYKPQADAIVKQLSPVHVSGRPYIGVMVDDVAAKFPHIVDFINGRPVLIDLPRAYAAAGVPFDSELEYEIYVPEEAA